jgi:hypothetical protein
MKVYGGDTVQLHLFVTSELEQISESGRAAAVLPPAPVNH